MPVIKYIAQLLGWLMNGIYIVIDKIGVPNIALAIVLFTIVIYLAMTPIQVSTQKSSKMMSVVQPELTKIQNKYKGKRDQASQMKMQEETQAVYRKYGVSPTGSCLPMVLQLVILFALYQVILNIPGYIARVREIFDALAIKITSVAGYNDILSTFISDNKIRVSFKGDITQANVIDLLYTMKPAHWAKLQEISAFSGFSQLMTDTAAKSQKINSLLGINISESPLDAIRSGFSGIASGNGSAILVLGIIIGILIPVLAWFSQWLNYKLMPQQNTGNSDNPMMGSMKTMNNVMPLFSAFICISFSMGIGIYWIIGAAIRCVQQVVINRRIAKMDAHEMIRVAQEKRAKKQEKKKDYVSNLDQHARQGGKNLSKGKYTTADLKDIDYSKNAENARPDSITAKANMVKKYNEEHPRENRGKKRK